MAKQLDAGHALPAAESIVAAQLEGEISRAAAASIGPDDPEADTGADASPSTVLKDGDAERTLDQFHGHDDPEIRALFDE